MAADRILAAKRVDIYGLGASGMTASYLDLKLMRLGLRTKAFTDPHLAAISAVALDEASVAIAISSSGSTRDTIEAVDIAQSAGAFVIAVVNRPLSPIAKRVQCVLLGSSHESPLADGAVRPAAGVVPVARGAILSSRQTSMPAEGTFVPHGSHEKLYAASMPRDSTTRFGAPDRHADRVRSA